MCGIIGVALAQGIASPQIHEGLKRLEYRGYDSVGVATISDGKILIKKDAGKIDEVHRRLNLTDLPGTLGIGHTRWATHGAPSEINAHPHTDCNNQVSVAHNGIIENFQELRKELADRGHTLTTRTDTEVMPHLIEENLKQGLDLLEATRKTALRLEGSYGITVISASHPDTIVCARKESPLVLGIGRGANYCASDVTAFLQHTDKAIYLVNGEIAKITPQTYEIHKLADGSRIARKPEKITWTPEMAQKGGYPHFMLKEIHEQPSALRDALRLQDIYVDLIAEFLDRAKEIYLVAAGTSHHACLAASYMFSKLARLTTYPVIASEFIEGYGPSVSIDSVILAVSQSGETADVLNALEFARLRAATIIGITNVVGSTLTRIARAYLVQQSGPEIGVAATKTFTSQLTVLARLAQSIARRRGKISQDETDAFKKGLQQVPQAVEKVLTLEPQIRALAKKHASKSSFFFLGRGISTATALEGRLKLLEIAYIPALAYPAGESKHGPISLIEEGTTVFFVAPPDTTRKQTISNIMEMKARGATIIALADHEDTEVKELADDFIGIPTKLPDPHTPKP